MLAVVLGVAGLFAALLVIGWVGNAILSVPAAIVAGGVHLIRGLPFWADCILAAVVLALTWRGVGTEGLKRGGLLAVAYLAMIVPAVVLIWWLTSL
ncbi:hypothetical protein BH10PSE5_BH10PSE5_20650 [soil metagenome]